MRLSPPDTHFTAETTEATRTKCLAQGHNIVMPGFELSTSVSRNRHSNHMTNMLHIKVSVNLNIAVLFLYIQMMLLLLCIYIHSIVYIVYIVYSIYIA